MSMSHNPRGKAKITDEEIVDLMDKARMLKTEGARAVSARDVSTLSPIEKQAMLKRLQKLRQSEEWNVRGWKAVGWVFYREGWHG